ncbi:hypothetical protein EMIT0P253_190058 [Pseudomonas sp. IT-P253]
MSLGSPSIRSPLALAGMLAQRFSAERAL